MSAGDLPSQILNLEAIDWSSITERAKHTVCIVGCGRIGLPTACVVAEAGFRVIGVDTDSNVVGLLKRGRAPFVETGLAALLKKHVRSGNLKPTTDTKKAVSQSDIIMIIVPTVIDEKKKPDYSYVEKSCKDVGTGLNRDSLVIFASTVGPGITETLVKETLENTSGLKVGIDFSLVNSATRAAPGQILQDLVSYPRVVGAIDEKSFKIATLFFRTFVKSSVVRVHDLRTAEMVKLFENVYRDVSLALSNELGLSCEKLKVDYLEAQAAANTQHFCHLLRPGLVAGHVPKDPYLLMEEAENASARLSMVALARKVNDGMLDHAIQLAKDALGERQRPFKNAKVALLGVSYRANIKESRGTAVTQLAKLFATKGAVVRVFDPLFSYSELNEMGLPAERTLEKAVEGADCLVVVVGHNRFRHLSLKKVKLLMTKAASIVDMGNAIQPEKAEKAGFIYRGVGRGAHVT